MALSKDLTVDELITRAIEGEVKAEGERLMAEAVKKVQAELERRTPEIVAGITVAVMKMADYQIMQDRVVFTIRTAKKE